MELPKINSADEAIEIRLHAKARIYFHLTRAAAEAMSDAPLGSRYDGEMKSADIWRATWAVANNWLIEQEESRDAG